MSNSEWILAVDAKQLAKLLGISVRHISRMDASGKMPRPVKFGRSKRWLLDEIKRWVAAESPNRATWEQSKGERHGR